MEALPEPLGGDQNKGPGYNAANATFCALACIFVLSRLFVRVRMIHSVGWDDACICLAMALSITIVGTFTAAEIAGFGRHAYYLSYAQLTRALKYMVLTEAIFILNLTFSKIAMCLLLLRILDQSRGKKKKVFLYFTIGLVTITGAITLGNLLGQCHPISKQWNPMKPGHCDDVAVLEKISYFNGAVCAWVDFSLAAFPLSFIRDLHLSPRKKVALAGLLSCGVFAGICAVIRTSLESRYSNVADLTWALADGALWGLIETNVTIIVACIPTLQPLYLVVVKTLSSSTKLSHDNDPSTPPRHQARSYSNGFKRKGTFAHLEDIRDADDLEAEMPIELTTTSYVSSGAEKDSGSGKGLVYNAAMPGITAETDIRVSRAHVRR